MKIIDYTNSANITVEFQDSNKYKISTTYQNFKRGTVKNPYDITVYGVGYLGVGEYVCWVEGEHTSHYTLWENILARCYNEKDRHNRPTYKDCIVCDEWLNFQNFAKWYDENAYDTGDGSRLHIDKDILVSDNKTYSPDTCILVPQPINMLFMTKSKKIDSDLPNGINRSMNGYKAQYNAKHLGTFKTLKEAIVQRETERRKHIKKTVNRYKSVLPFKVYNALLTHF